LEKLKEMTMIEWPQAGGEVEAGEYVRDRKRPNKTGTVLDVSDIPASEYSVDALGKTIAADNPQYPGSDPVVALVWSECSSTGDRAAVRDQQSVYHFPLTRLVCESCIRDIPPRSLHPSPYDQRSFSWDENRNRQYIHAIRSQRYHNSVLLARETDAGPEIVAGHKRRWVAQEAGLDTVAVRLVDLSEWEAAIHYAEDHLSTLSDETAQQTVSAFVDRWGQFALSLEPVEATVERLDLDIETTSSRIPHTG
jgi:hypothetical protein